MDVNELYAIIDEFGDKFVEDTESMEKLKKVRDGIGEMGQPKYSDSDVFDTDGKRFSEKYENAKRMYRERFFSTPNEAKEEQEENIELDDKSADIKFEDLFEKREGD